MKVAQADISRVMQEICQQFESLKEKLEDDIGNVNSEALTELITKLHKSINRMSREINQSSSVAPFASELTKTLERLVTEIQRIPAYSQALGPEQIELVNLFKRLHTNITHAHEKVQM